MARKAPAAEGATAPETLRPPDRFDSERWKAGRAMPVRTEGVIRASRGEISQVTRQRGRIGFVRRAKRGRLFRLARIGGFLIVGWDSIRSGMAVVARIGGSVHCAQG